MFINDDQINPDFNQIKSELDSDENQLDTSNSSPSIDNSNSNSIIMKIFSYSKELVLIFAFILTTIATIQNNSGPRISRAPPPVPFFSTGSFIEDYYYGQLTPTQTKVTLSELSFVFYYAPWSSESQHARSAYEHISRLFYKEAYFSAINCWQPNSECRMQYSKITTWPILMAYTRNGFGVQYQKNLWTESALTKFVRSMLNPLKRISSTEELLDFMSTRDTVVVAFIDYEAHSRQYNSFQRAALKFIEKDPFNEVGFGVVLGQTVTEFGVDRVPAIRVYLWNETLEYNGNLTWKSRDIIKFVQEHIQQVSLYLSPPGIKSSSLAPYMKQGPILLLFTPRNLYLDFSDSYVMLRQIGMEYYNCKDDDWVHEVARDYLFNKRKENRERLKHLQRKCLKLFQEAIQTNNLLLKRCKPSTSSVSYLGVLNSSKNIESSKNIPNYCELNDLQINPEKCECSSDSCLQYTHRMYTFDPNEDVHLKKYSTSMLDNRNDEKSPESIDRYNFKRQCEMIRLAEERSEITFIDDSDTTPLKLITGLACKSNKTLTLISMDSINFHIFAERLGVDILELENKTVAMIMDQDNESTYLLDESVTLNSLSRFIYRYHRDGLERFLRTNSIQYRHTHFFDINEFLIIKKREKIERNEMENKKKCPADEFRKKDSHIVIREINSEDFDSAVIKSNKTVVILFYSTNCAFCSMMSHSVLTVSRILHKMPNIEFLRIEGDKNDLAWHYTMAEFPSLLVFPSGSKSDSRKFSSKMSINVTNVLGFVLANLNRSYRLLGLIMACNYKRQNSTNDCILTIQDEVEDTISFALREWRKHSRKRSAVLRLIKQLKEIYLKLFRIENSCDFIEIEKDVFHLITRWQKAKIF